MAVPFEDHRIGGIVSNKVLIKNDTRFGKDSSCPEFPGMAWMIRCPPVNMALDDLPLSPESILDINHI